MDEWPGGKEEGSMKIFLEYFAQVRRAAGLAKEHLELPEESGLGAALGAAAVRHGPEFRSLVLEESGAIRPSIIVLVNGTPAGRGGQGRLAAGDTVALLSAVAGG
jgi:molybdopterin converting factor small subunit